MSVDLGSLSFDESTVLKQLRGDMKDDWFADPLGYADMTTGAFLNDLINTNFTANNGIYLPSKRQILNLPKPNFTLRYGLETSLTDRFLFHALTAELVPVFDSLLGPTVYSHRYNYTKPDPRYLFKRGIPAWNDFIGSVRSAIVPTSCLLSTDLTNYFESVELSSLKTSLVSLLSEVALSPPEKNRIRIVVEELFRCLASWTFRTERGLPQNRDASSFLANIYMMSVDRIMHKHGYAKRYFRYMDDIKIVCEDEFEARTALKALSLALRDLGLSVNAKKTELIPGSDADKLDACLQQASPEITYLDSIWATNKPSLILSHIDTLKDLMMKALEEGNFSSKEFRFCIARLCTLRLCKDFSVPEPFFNQITEGVLAGLTAMPAATDQIARYLRAAPLADTHYQQVEHFMLDAKKATYSWQGYHLWVALTDKKFATQALLDRAREYVQHGADTPSRAGASLYAGSLGSTKDREIIAVNFSTLQSFQGQRLALIAVHELPFSPHIETHIKPNVRPDLMGVYSQLRQKKGVYCNTLEPVLLGQESYEEPES